MKYNIRITMIQNRYKALYKFISLKKNNLYLSKISSTTFCVLKKKNLDIELNIKLNLRTQNLTKQRSQQYSQRFLAQK